MPRWLWWAPIAVITLLLALGTYRVGSRLMTLDETDVITLYVARYLDEGAQAGRAVDPGDCIARPGAVDTVWIVVRCTAADGTVYAYPVDRRGRLIVRDTATRPEA